MSADTQGTAMPHWPRIRVMRLWDVLNRAKDRNDLCQWLIGNAGSGRCQMYWEVPRGYIVRFGSRRIFGGYGESSISAEPLLPPEGSPLPNVKFVRLAPTIAERVAQQACQTGTFVKPAIPADRFPGGLIVPDSAGEPTGILEVLPATTELYIQLLSPTARNAWEIMDIDPTRVYLDENVFDEIRPHLETASDVQITAGSTTAATAQPDVREIAPTASREDGAASTAVQATPVANCALKTFSKITDEDAPVKESSTSPDANDACRRASIESSDPYNLKDRADAVYVLYQVAERCSRTAAFGSEPSATKRHSSAEALLLAIIENSPRLRSRVFSDTRRAQAVKFIDMERDPKSGSKLAKNRVWPTPDAQMVLDAVDDRRQLFMNPTLELVIHVTGRWLDEVPDNRGSKSSLEALDKLLAEYGLDLSVERMTLFPIITWNGVRCWPAPKAAKQSTSRAVGARHASPRRGA